MSPERNIVTDRQRLAEHIEGLYARVEVMLPDSAVGSRDALKRMRDLALTGVGGPNEEALHRINELCAHGIPYYAYGDNQAACEMANRLKEIANLLPPIATSCPISQEKP
jgi:hypothetical protein